MSERRRIVLVGGSGHAKVVADAARCQGYQVAAVFDDDPARHGATVLGIPVVGACSALAVWCREQGVGAAVVAIGDNRVRLRLADLVRQGGLALATVVHPRATVAASATIGPGTVIMAGAVVNSDAVLGANVIVNTGATVDHDCEVGDGVHIAPGATLCGNVRLGEASLVGAGATVIPGRVIGAGAVVGAGATVITDVRPGVTVAGSPARPLP